MCVHWCCWFFLCGLGSGVLSGGGGGGGGGGGTRV